MEGSPCTCPGAHGRAPTIIVNSITQEEQHMNLSVYRLPFAKWISARDTLKQDVVAGITVSLVAIPQSLAYAQLAGVPAYYGLYAALIPTIIGALFGSSRQLSTGPVAMTSLLTAASVAPMAAHGTDLYYSY